MYNDYANNPLKFLYHTRKSLLPKYLWCIWLLVGILLIILNFMGYLDFSNFSDDAYVDFSVSGLSFTLVVVSAAIEVFSEDELVVLLESSELNKDNEFLGLLAPYAFTAVIFVLIGIISLVGPYINIGINSEYLSWLNISYILLVLLGILSLFNIIYQILNDLYYSIKRKKIIKNKK